VVDVDDCATEPSEAAVVAGIRALERVPCATVVLKRGPLPPRYKALVERFDIVLDSEVDLVRIAGMARRRPLASMALVQLLRQSERLDVHHGLVAESWVYSTLQSGPEFGRWLAEREPAASRSEGRAEVSEGPAVSFESFRGVLSLTLNRPHKHNAFSAEMRDGLVEGLTTALVDPDIREIVVRGRGASFCSGGDLDEFGTFPDPATAHAVRSTRNAARLLADLSQRVRFEVHGACIGAGVELPAFAKNVVAHENAFFQLPELELGLVPGAGGTVSLPRRIGRQRTAWLALTGRRIDAVTAQQWGLVDEVRLAPLGAGDS
jgi:enoyl-CoA hydratase/carnithine racemase